MASTKIQIALLAGALAAGQAFAAPSNAPSNAKAPAAHQAPLPPGRAAPVREAQGIGRPLLYWAAGGALIITGVILISQDGDDDDTTTTATTGTGN
jgi:hypothetical protein